MRIGEPFNPYRVFQGAFAPFWLLEHPALGAGAKICYIRLLGFAGRDGRCYPSMTTLGAGLGVSERQARDYVRELQRVGLIGVDQRGLRRTNVYVFLWTDELAQLGSVPAGAADVGECNDAPDDDEPEETTSASDRNNPSGPERNSCSGSERKKTAVQERNKRSGQDRNRSSAPSGISSEGIRSRQSSSSSLREPPARSAVEMTTKRTFDGEPGSDPAGSGSVPEFLETLREWAQGRGLHRLRSDRRLGPPDHEVLVAWAAILDRAGICSTERIAEVMDAARSAADRSGEWRNWAFLTLQVQFAAERTQPQRPGDQEIPQPQRALAREDPDAEWARMKRLVRESVGEIPYTNWFEHTRQVGRFGGTLTIGALDRATKEYLDVDYRELIGRTAAQVGIEAVQVVLM